MPQSDSTFWQGFLPRHAIRMTRVAEAHPSEMAHSAPRVSCVFVCRFSSSPSGDSAARTLLQKMIDAMEIAPQDYILFDGIDSETHPMPSGRIHVVFGEAAAQKALGTARPLTELRGAFHSAPHSPSTFVMATWHPETLLTQPALKREAWNDLKQVVAHLAQRNS